jgi:FixJ family two-component response regulator
MYTSRTTPTNGTCLPVTVQPTRPVVHFLTDDGPERAALDSTLSSAGFRAQPLASASSFPTPPDVLQPTCLVMDGKMMSPFNSHEPRGIPIICLAAEGDVATAVRAMKAGAIDVLARPVEPCLLVDAVHNALDVSAASLRRAAERRRLEERYADLSQREREVMGLVVAGLMNKQVAYELRISEITVKAHRGRMMRKMDARSLASLVQMANQLGLTAPSGRA